MNRWNLDRCRHGINVGTPGGRIGALGALWVTLGLYSCIPGSHFDPIRSHVAALGVLLVPLRVEKHILKLFGVVYFVESFRNRLAAKD